MRPALPPSVSTKRMTRSVMRLNLPCEVPFGVSALEAHRHQARDRLQADLHFARRARERDRARRSRLVGLHRAVGEDLHRLALRGARGR
jgi:hypothetical protein